MHLSRCTAGRRATGRRLVGTIATFATASTLLVGVGISQAGPAGAVKVPPKPAPVYVPARPDPVTKVTQGQVDQATSAQNAVAEQIGSLGAQIAEQDHAIAASKARLEQIEQNVARAVGEFQDAEAAQVSAKDKVRSAGDRVAAAHKAFVAYVQASYADGQVTGTTGSLLTADDPSALLDRSTLEQYEQASQVNAIAAMQAATVARSNAEAAARRAVARTAEKKKQAEAARVAAKAQVASEQAEQAQLEHDRAVQQTKFDAAQATLVNVTQGHAAYVSYVAKQTAYRNAVNAKAAADKQLDAHNKAVATNRAQAEARARAAAARAQARADAAAAKHGHHSRHHGSGGGHSVAPPPSSGPTPGAGGWSLPKAKLAVQRAMRWLGTIYIWAGGDRYGPTDGFCTDPVSPCGTRGFDCSGLVLYAWGRDWAHQASQQYSQAGSYHPSPGNFKRGDLLFWSGSGTRGGISHVAIYIGNNNVIQAPQSGDYVKITPWRQVESGYYGATRPLT